MHAGSHHRLPTLYSYTQCALQDVSVAITGKVLCDIMIKQAGFVHTGYAGYHVTTFQLSASPEINRNPKRVEWFFIPLFISSLLSKHKNSTDSEILSSTTSCRNVVDLGIKIENIFFDQNLAI